MTALDQWLGQLGSAPWGILLVALLLGLRHATDPDHVAAVSTLLLGDHQGRRHQAPLLGAAWGLGHGTTLVLFGLPIVLFRRSLPETAHQLAEVAIGVVIIGLAIRLLVRWRRGYFHVHPHQHSGQLHAHPHFHEHPSGVTHPAAHQHRHVESWGRTPLTSFGVGLVHGVGGTAGAGILMVTAADTPTAGVLALILFAVGTALSMILLTWLLGIVLTRTGATRRMTWLIPALGVVSLCFGVWYSLGALAG